MSAQLARLLDAAGPAFAARLEAAAGPFVAARSEETATIDGPALTGLARVLATGADTAALLSRSPEILEPIATLAPGALRARETRLEAELEALCDGDVEDVLDGLRLRRRREMALAACGDLGGIAPFDEVSHFLSVVAETTTRAALSLAGRDLAPAEGGFAVIGMGKIAGREFTYHSDLDLIFLYQGGPEDITRASRLGQRLISYLTARTRAGIAFEVDTRLRPSGGQGMLVTSVSGFERYQLEKAQTWEHLAMLRARPIAGACDAPAETLARVRERVTACGEPPWAELATLRARVIEERAKDSDEALSLKTGAGGLMDVDFIAGGAVLECGVERFPAFPSVAEMLRSVATGPRVEALLDDYGWLRRVEARARWIAGRGVESLAMDDETLPVLAELVAPGGSSGALRDALHETRSRIRAAFQAVIDAGTIAALSPER